MARLNWSRDRRRQQLRGACESASGDHLNAAGIAPLFGLESQAGAALPGPTLCVLVVGIGAFGKEKHTLETCVLAEIHPITEALPMQRIGG